MTAPLDPSRFRELADAYGGVVARWPEQHREAAAHFGETAEGSALLARASALDVRLDAWRVPSPSSALAARVFVGAPSAVNGLGTQLRWWRGQLLQYCYGRGIWWRQVVIPVNPSTLFAHDETALLMTL